MKQGRAQVETTKGTKVEPNSRGVSPEAVDQLGQALGYKRSTTVYEGRGLKAPMVGEDSHPCGSQGKH